MELYEEILANLESKSASPQMQRDIMKQVEMECYHTLQKIKAVLADDSFTDQDCFIRIEEIVCLFEELGSNGGNRHDFG